IREALGDNAQTPQYIETLPRRGYRFIAPVERLASTALSEDAEAQRVASIEQEIAPKTTAAINPPRPFQWRTAAIALVVLLPLAFYGLRQRFTSQAGPRTGKLMLAVLPFENLSADAAQDYFSDGLTEEMITQLG